MGVPQWVTEPFSIISCPDLVKFFNSKHLSVHSYCRLPSIVSMTSNLHENRCKNDLYPSFSFGWSMVGYVLSSITILLSIYAWILTYENADFSVLSRVGRQLTNNDTSSPVNQTYIQTTQLVANISVFGAMIMSSYGQAFKQEAMGIVKGSKEDLELALERTRREEIFKNRLTHAVSVISRLPFPVTHWPPMFAQVRINTHTVLTLIPNPNLPL